LFIKEILKQRSQVLRLKRLLIRHIHRRRGWMSKGLSLYLLILCNYFH